MLFAPTKSSSNGTPEPEPRPPTPIASTCRQLVLVRTPSWTTSSGTLQRYERTDSPAWQPAGEATPVNLGRNGMAWGRGLHASHGKGPVKKEGDGKTPAGVFALQVAFGAAEQLPASSKGFPYVRMSSSSYCVEDVRSKFYNQIIDATEVKATSWQRWSKMMRPDGLFRWGIVVRQNDPETKTGAGSCVFLHIWRGSRRSTSGCTAMPLDQIQETLRWLDGEAKPLLVQLPEPEYQRLRDSWELP